MKQRSRTPAARSYRTVLLAHDVGASTCDTLITALEGALQNVDILDASSVEDALAAVRGVELEVCFVCLDLPPAPTAGARLAEMLLQDGHAVVLVTRSLRWLPQNHAVLRLLPWIQPDAASLDVKVAIEEALRKQAFLSSATGSQSGVFDRNPSGGLSPASPTMKRRVASRDRVD